MEIRYTAKAQKQIRRIGPAKNMILNKIEQYAAAPSSLANNVKGLKGENLYRLRVGDYRVLFFVAEDGTIMVMTVTAIAHRSEVYD